MNIWPTRHLLLIAYFSWPRYVRGYCSVKTKVYNRQGTESYNVRFMSMNMIFDKENKLPGITAKPQANGLHYVHFEASTSPVYKETTNFNTRIKYKCQVRDGFCIAYINFNPIDRVRIKFINKSTWFHSHTIPTLALIVAFLGLLLSPLLVQLFFGNDHNQSTTLDSIPLKTKVQKTHNKIQFAADSSRLDSSSPKEKLLIKDTNTP